MPCKCGCITEAEAREREREAVLAYYREGLCNAPRWIDLRYPSLLPKSPPPLVLASGVKITKSGARTYQIILTDGKEYWGNTVESLGHFARTIDDYTAIAKWLGSTEEAK